MFLRVNLKRVYRIWRREGLKVPQKQPKRGRLWLNDGSCIRLRPERPGHVWCYDFGQSLPSRRCFVPGDWRAGISVSRGVAYIMERLACI